MRDTPKKARLTMQDRDMDVQEGVKLRSVRRRLFPEDDDYDTEWKQALNSGEMDNATNRFMEEIRRDKAEARERWNFDFEKEKPLSGRYEWVKVDKDGNEVPCENVEENSQLQNVSVQENGDSDNNTRNIEKSNALASDDVNAASSNH